ncbi:MAG: N-acetyl-gamma-glutamyl-phosphate reductase [Calditrichia bacterium]
MIGVGIIGGTGYTAGELLRLLSLHPQVKINYVTSRKSAGERVPSVHSDLLNLQELTFTEFPTEADVVFLCLPHGQSAAFLNEHPELYENKIIDLSQDFRDDTSKFVYGLPEKNRQKIQQSQFIANPGCFATAIELMFLPLASEGLLKGDIHVTGITGSTGAGNQLSETSHFSWRNNNLSTYKVFTHQHLKEINAVLQDAMSHSGAGNDNDFFLNFIPFRGPFTRGIFISGYLNIELKTEDLQELYHDFYKHEPFVFVSEKQLHLKQVINTNNVVIHPTVIQGKAVVECVIDNLVKGASGQAVQNMNLMEQLEETTGLRMKSMAY